MVRNMKIIRPWSMCLFFGIGLLGCVMLFLRIDQVGVPNLFNRQHCFDEASPLSRELAKNLADRTLRADGIESESWGAPGIELHSDKGRAIVYWSGTQTGDGVGYDVVINLDGQRACCRALRPK
jgi:hypothetical protein